MGWKEYCLNYHRFDFEIGSYAKNMERQLMAFWPAGLARLLPDFCLNSLGDYYINISAKIDGNKWIR